MSELLTHREMHDRALAARRRNEEAAAKRVVEDRNSSARMIDVVARPLEYERERQGHVRVDDADLATAARSWREAGHRSARVIVQEVAVAHGLTYGDLVGPRRTARIVFARQDAIAAVKTAFPHYSLPRIGRLFGGRDHTTILHALRQHAKRNVA